MMRFSTHRPGFGSTSALSVGSSSSASSSSVPHRVRRHDLLPAAPHFSERLPKFWLKSLIYTKIGCPRKLWSVCWRQGLPNKKKRLTKGWRGNHGRSMAVLSSNSSNPKFHRYSDFGLSINGGTPVHHPFLFGILHEIKPSSDKEEWWGMMISPGHRKKWGVLWRRDMMIHASR